MGERYVVIGGAGRQGQAIVKYLVDTRPECIIEVWDPDMVGAAQLYGKYSRVGCFDQYRTDAINSHYKDTVFIDCLRPEENVDVAWRCLQNHVKGYINLGGDDDSTQKIRDFPEPPDNINLDYATLVLDCGIAPGLVSCIAGDAARAGKRNVEIYCGGIAKQPAKIHYVRSFSMEGLIGEYLNCALFISKNHGGTRYFPTLGIDPVEPEFEGRNLQARYTSGGLSFTPHVLESKLDRLVYATIREKKYWEWLIKDVLWRPDAAKMLELLHPEVGPDNPDVMYLQTNIDLETKKYQWDYDHKNNISAMAQATGYSAGAVATMIQDGLVMAGWNGMHDLPLDETMRRIRLMPNQMKEVE